MKRLAALLGIFLVAGFLLTAPPRTPRATHGTTPTNTTAGADGSPTRRRSMTRPRAIRSRSRAGTRCTAAPGSSGSREPRRQMPTCRLPVRPHTAGTCSAARAEGRARGIFPVTGDVRLKADFRPGSSTDLDVNFTDLQVHRKTTGENPVDLPSVRFKFDNDDANGVIGGRQDADAVGRVGRNGFDADYDDHGIQWPSSREFYNWRLRRMYRDAAITGDFYGPNAEGVAGKFYFVEGQFSGNQTGSRPGKTEIRASESGLSSCSSKLRDGVLAGRRHVGSGQIMDALHVALLVAWVCTSVAWARARSEAKENQRQLWERERQLWEREG